MDAQNCIREDRCREKRSLQCMSSDTRVFKNLIRRSNSTCQRSPETRSWFSGVAELESNSRRPAITESVTSFAHGESCIRSSWGTHQSLNCDAPGGRPVRAAQLCNAVEFPAVHGLHHAYLPIGCMSIRGAKANSVQRDTDGDGYGNSCDGAMNFTDMGLIKSMFFISPGPSGLAP